MADPRGAQRHVDEAGAVAHQIFDGFIGDEALSQELGAAVEHLAKDERRELPALQLLGNGRQVGPVSGRLEKLAAGVQEAAAAAGSAAAAPSVSTS